MRCFIFYYNPRNSQKNQISQSFVSNYSTNKINIYYLLTCKRIFDQYQNSVSYDSIYISLTLPLFPFALDPFFIISPRILNLSAKDNYKIYNSFHGNTKSSSIWNIYSILKTKTSNGLNNSIKTPKNLKNSNFNKYTRNYLI